MGKTKGILEALNSNNIQKYKGNITIEDLYNIVEMKIKKSKYFIYADYLLLLPDIVFKAIVLSKNTECLGSAAQIKLVIERAKKLGINIKMRKPIKKYGKKIKINNITADGNTG